jgi:hypothetical protein
MRILTFKNVDILNVIGDIHGNFSELSYNINKRFLLENSLNIVLGDCGIGGFHKDEYYIIAFDKLNRDLKKNNNYVVFFRGNHEPPEYFNGEKNKIFDQFSNVYVIPDYSIVSINDSFNILCIGGAISVDRTDRLYEMTDKFKRHSFRTRMSPKVTYWKDENVIYDGFKLDEINKLYPSSIHLVATHTCPYFAFPTTKFGIEGWLSKDPYLEEDLDIERKTMTQIYNHLIKEQPSILTWAYGHFHKHNVEYNKDNIKFLACNCMEFNEIRF